MCKDKDNSTLDANKTWKAATAVTAKSIDRLLQLIKDRSHLE